MTPDTIEKVVSAMSENLPDGDVRRGRLADGCRLLIPLMAAQAPSHEHAKLLNKFVVPVFVRLVYLRHRYDIPVETYIEEVYGYMEAALAIDSREDLPVIHPIKSIIPSSLEEDPNARDFEAEMLAMCVNDFSNHIIKLYPVVR